MSSREYEIVVFGATGFTGRLVAEYLNETYGKDLRWAIAGRNREKLDQVSAELGLENVPIEVADSQDEQALDRLTARTQVVCTTVGPYAKYGSNLVAACARNGTSYCDLAGEVPWMRQMIDAHETAAQESGARIVHCCGFDSIPSDLGAQFLEEQAMERLGQPASRVKMRVRAMRGTASGGTIASMIGIVESARADRRIAKLLYNPYSLNPEGMREGPDKPDPRSAAFDEDFDAWVAPFIMGSINCRVVRRTHALLGQPWGEDFRYDEAILTGRGLSGRVKAHSTAVGLGAFAVSVALGPTRAFMKRFVLPEPGEGPDQQARLRGFFKLLFHGRTADGQIINTSVSAKRDPGYGATCRMLGESAVSLARDVLTVGGGFWTPASAMGPLLRDRLVERAEFSFEVTE